MTARSAEMQAADSEPGDRMSDGTVQRHSSRWATLNLSVQILKAVFLFGSQMVLARLLSPAEFGIVAMASPLINFVNIFGDFGLSHATVQRQGLTQFETSQIFWINFLLGVMICIVVMVMAVPVSMFFHEPRLRMVLIVLAGSLIINSLASVQVTLMFREMRAIPLALTEVVPVTVNVSSSILAALLGFGYWALVIGQICHAVAAACTAWTLSSWRPLRPSSRLFAVKDSAKSMVAFGSHIAGYNVITFLGTNLDNVLIGSFLGNVAIGLYDRGFKLVLMSYWQIAIPHSRIAQSLLARLLQQKDAYVRSFKGLLEGAMLVIVPGLVCVSVMSDLTVNVLFGSAWSQTAPVVRGLALGTILAPVATAGTWLFVSQARTSSMVPYGIASTSSVIVSLLIGLPWGTEGVASSYAIFSVFTHGVVIFGATRHGPVTRRDVFSACGPVLISAAIAAIPLYFWRLEYPALGLPSFVTMAFCLVGTYAVTGLVLLCFPSGRQTLHNVRSFVSSLR